MSSGVSVADECVTVFNEVKLGKKYRYVIYRLSDDLRKIIVEEKGGKDKTYEDFTQSLEEAQHLKQCRYAVYDLEFMVSGMKRTKLPFFLWSPENATVKQKMVYTSSKNAIKSKLVGIGPEIQATDDNEIAYSHIMEKCQEKSY